jgi:hypothetical protein
MEWRRGALASLSQQLACLWRMPRPTQRCRERAIAGPRAARRGCRERVRQAEDAAEHEATVSADLHFDPASCLTTAADRLAILRDEPLIPALLHDGLGREAVIRQTPRGADHAARPSAPPPSGVDRRIHSVAPCNLRSRISIVGGRGVLGDGVALRASSESSTRRRRPSADSMRGKYSSCSRRARQDSVRRRHRRAAFEVGGPPELIGQVARLWTRRHGGRGQNPNNFGLRVHGGLAHLMRKLTTRSGGKP